MRTETGLQLLKSVREIFGTLWSDVEILKPSLIEYKLSL